MDSWDILKLQNITYAQSQIACGMVELEAMKAANRQYSHDEPYTEKDFRAIIDKYQMSHNAVLTNLQHGL